MIVRATRITPVVIAIVVRDDGKILMTDRKFTHPATEDPQVKNPDFWQFPGGEVNIGETLEEAVIREIKEEVNLEIKIVHYVPYVHTSLRPRWHGILHYFICMPISDIELAKVNHESTKLRWFKHEEIEALLTFSDT